MQTTLNKIKAHKPCKPGWKQLLKHFGKTKADDEPLPLLTILDSNGLYDAIWCFRAIEGRDKEIRLYAVWCARQVQHLMKDPRSLAALDVAERYANGEATEEELAEAEAAARDAAAAARDAVRDSSLDAMCYATRNAHSAAANDAKNPTVWLATSPAQAARLREVCNEVQGAKQ